MGIDPITMMIVGQGLNMANNASASRSADRATARGINQQAGHQAEADARFNKMLSEIAASNPGQVREGAMEQYLGRLGERPQVSATPVAGANPRFAEDLAQSEQTLSTRGNEMADFMSRIDAPAIQRRQEGERIGRAGVDIGQTARVASGDDYLSRLRVSGIRPNPWVTALADLTSGAALGSASKGPATKGTGYRMPDSFVSWGRNPGQGSGPRVG